MFFTSTTWVLETPDDQGMTVAWGHLFSFFRSFYKLTYNNTFLCVQFQCLIQFFTMYINECLDRIGVGEIYNVKGGRVKNVEIFGKGLCI